MTEVSLVLLLDQNVPLETAHWLKEKRSTWQIFHVNDLSFSGRPDDFLYRWAQENRAIIITYDEDFADARMYPLGRHHGIIRLRVWPTTIEKTQEAISRLLADLPTADWQGALVIIDNRKIRVRRL